MPMATVPVASNTWT